MSWLQKLHQLEEEKAQQPPRLISIQPPVIPAMEPANDPALHDWETTDRAYQQHVAHCPQCRSAGQGYGARCEAGAELWQAHQSAPMPAKLAKARPALAPSRPAPSTTPYSLATLLQAAMLACDYWGMGPRPERPCGRTAWPFPQTSAWSWRRTFSRCMEAKPNDWCIRNDVNGRLSTIESSCPFVAGWFLRFRKESPQIFTDKGAFFFRCYSFLVSIWCCCDLATKKARPSC